MTPTTFFSCDNLSCDVYMCLPSGKVLDDCIQYFHTLVKKFKYIVMKLKFESHTWPVSFTNYKQVQKNEKVNRVHTSGISLVNCREAHCIMVSSTNATMAALSAHNNSLSFEAQVAGIPISISLDTLACENFISAEFVRLHNIAIDTSNKVSVTLGDGSESDILGKVSGY